MKKFIAFCAVVAMALPASATIIHRTNPSLIEIQAGIDACNRGDEENCKYEHYPGVVRKTASGGRILPASSGYLFGKHLKEGAVLPRIVDAQALLRAAKKKQVVEVASLGDVSICFPVFEEIAHQNGVSCSSLMGHLIEWEEEDAEIFTNVMATAELAAEAAEKEIESTIKDEVTEKVEEELDVVIHSTGDISIEDELDREGLTRENLFERVKEAYRRTRGQEE